MTLGDPALAKYRAQNGITDLGGFDPVVASWIKRASAATGADPVALAATSLMETGMQRGRLGDGGTSAGPFQHHKGGALGNHTFAWANSYAAVLERAQQFSKYKVKGGKGAAAIQRPADPSLYASGVDGVLARARAIMGTVGVPVSPREGLAGQLPAAAASTPRTVTGFKRDGPQAALDILNSKSPGEALTLYKDARTKVKFEVDPGVAAETGGPGISPNATGIVELAKSFLGTPYSWGGGNSKGPSKGIGRGANTVGFDCSAFLQYLWGRKGVKIPRTTYEQIKAGKAVQYNHLQPGDAVFFGSGKDPHHVGMYIGHGQFIQAPKTGDVVKISNLADRNDFVAARTYA